MSGTKTGGLLAAETNKLRHGQDFYQRIAKIGGQTPTSRPKGFAAMSPEKRKESGAKGGRVSKRTKVTPDFTNPDYSSEVHTTIYFTRSAKVRAFLRTVTGRA